MPQKYIWSYIVVFILILGAIGYKCFLVPSRRETIFDRKISIPQYPVLHIPDLPPFCDDLPGLNKGYASIKEGRMYYEQEGQGIPLILINGGPGCTHHLFHPYFSQLKDMARIIYYDQRGTGKSSIDNTGRTYTLNQAIDDLDSLRKDLKIDKWVVLGWSYGGLLAQLYALKYPEHCTGLVLGTADPFGGNEGLYTGVGPQYNRLTQFVSAKEFDAWKDLEKKAKEGIITPLQMIYNRFICGYWKLSFYHKPPEKETIKQTLYGFNQDPDFRKTMISEIAKINLQDKFANFAIPTLIVEGKWDFLWGDMDRVAIMRKNHPHAQIEVFEKSGHNIYVDEPEKFFNLLRKFLVKLEK